jgi:hypothetical protein
MFMDLVALIGRHIVSFKTVIASRWFYQMIKLSQTIVPASIRHNDFLVVQHSTGKERTETMAHGIFYHPGLPAGICLGCRSVSVDTS